MRERKRGDRLAVNSMLRTIKPSVNPLRERIGNLKERLLQVERKTENIQRGDYFHNHRAGYFSLHNGTN